LTVLLRLAKQGWNTKYVSKNTVSATTMNESMQFLITFGDREWHVQYKNDRRFCQKESVIKNLNSIHQSIIDLLLKEY